MTESIKAGVFDLDSTLYFSRDLEREIGRVTAVYLARIKGIDECSAKELIRATRIRLTSEMGCEASLSFACLALGGDLHELHRFFAREIVPEPFLKRDEMVLEMLAGLGKSFPLYIYTNNNRSLTDRIMKSLGLTNLFTRVFTIEDSWRPKPDRETIDIILAEIGRTPGECLFVGDRYDIDLRLPKELGATVHLVQQVEDLLALNRFTL
jgi:putative hydrolase of the HAD superfamily